MITHESGHSMSNIPPGSLCIYYSATNGKRGPYYLWKKLVGGVPRWYWSAMGNNGVCNSAEDAADQAKDWIKNGKNE